MNAIISSFAHVIKLQTFNRNFLCKCTSRGKCSVSLGYNSINTSKFRTGTCYAHILQSTKDSP